MVDAAGGVWDWTSSPFDPLVENSEQLVIHGGGWTDPVSATRSAFRGRVRSNFRSPYVGLRPARSLAR